MRRRLPHLATLIGVALLAFGCSGFAGGGSFRGDGDTEQGLDFAGDWSASYETTDRLLIVVGAVLAVGGALAWRER